MKLLYTNHGILTEAKVRYLLKNGVDVQIAGQSGLVEGVVEGGPSTRRAARDAAIDASISDFEEEPESELDDRELSPTSYPGPSDDLDPVNDFNPLGDEIPPGSTPMDTEEGWDFDFYEPWYKEPPIDEGRDLDDPNFFGDEPSEPETSLAGEVEDIPLLDIEKAGLSIPSAGIPDEEDDFTGYTFSDEEWFTKGKPEQASEEEEEDLSSNENSWFVEGRSLKENLRALVRECMDEVQKEELQHSQTGFADMQPAVVAEQDGGKPSSRREAERDFHRRALRHKINMERVQKLIESLPEVELEKLLQQLEATSLKETAELTEQEGEDEEWRVLLRRVRAGASLLNKEWPELFDKLSAAGVPKAMDKIRAMENVLDGITQELQLMKNVVKAKRRAANALTKNSLIKRFIPVELGGEFP